MQALRPTVNAEDSARNGLRILQVIWWGELGGIALNLGDMARQFHGSGHTLEVCVISSSGPLIDGLSSNDIHITEIGARSGFDIWGFVRFCRYLKNKRFDIVHVHGATFFVTLALMVGAGTARKVFQEHGVIRSHHRRTTRLLFYKLFRRVYDRFVAVSGATAEDLLWTGVPIDRVVTIPNPVDAVAFSPRPSRESAKERLGISGSVQTVGTACRFAPEKDLALFLEVAAIVTAARQGVRFIMVGAGDEQRSLEQRIEALHLTRSVRFTGMRTDMPLVWRAFNVYLFTSRLEPFGRTLLESLACETPVVAAVPTDGGAIELARRSPGILAVEDRNPQHLAALVVRLLDSPHECEELGRLGRIWAAEQYGVVEWARAFDSLYMTLHQRR
jgi:glycosyltransferase involved in cell wall biosynthesis